MAYEPDGDNAKEGTADATFNTFSSTLPMDVEPLAADNAQWPFVRYAEPRRPSGALELNPRDGLVTIIAYVRGEEFFWDNNSNGVRDSGEPFIDQGEPFIDANDSGQWEPGELFIDEGRQGTAGGNGVWDGPNGQWDDDATIWTEAHVLYTGLPELYTPQFAGDVQSRIDPPAFADECTGASPLARDAAAGLEGYALDLRLNTLEGGTTFAASWSGAKGSLVWSFQASLADSFGFRRQRILLDAADAQLCRTGNADGQVPSQRCVWRELFSSWSSGAVGSGYVKGAPASDSTSCALGTVTLKATVRNIITIVGSSAGGID